MNTLKDIKIIDIMNDWSRTTEWPIKQTFVFESYSPDESCYPMDIEYDLDVADDFIEDLSEDAELAIRWLVYTNTEHDKVIDVIDALYEHYCMTRYKDEKFLQRYKKLYRDELDAKYSEESRQW